MKARIEEETQQYQRIKQFYQSRIEHARKENPLPDLKKLAEEAFKTLKIQPSEVIQREETVIQCSSVVIYRNDDLI